MLSLIIAAGLLVLIITTLYIFNSTFKSTIKSDWSKIVIDIFLIIATSIFAIYMFNLQINQTKKDEFDLFKRNYALAMQEVAQNGSELRILKKHVKDNKTLPVIEPHLTYDISKEIMSNPLILKYSGYELQLAYNYYVKSISVANYYFDKIYQVRIKDSINVEQLDFVNFFYDKVMPPILVYEMLLNLYAIGYEGNIIGPGFQNREIMTWLKNGEFPSVDSLNIILKEMDEADPKTIKKFKKDIRKYWE